MKLADLMIKLHNLTEKEKIETVTYASKYALFNLLILNRLKKDSKQSLTDMEVSDAEIKNALHTMSTTWRSHLEFLNGYFIMMHSMLNNLSKEQLQKEAGACDISRFLTNSSLLTNAFSAVLLTIAAISTIESPDEVAHKAIDESVAETINRTKLPDNMMTKITEFSQKINECKDYNEMIDTALMLAKGNYMDTMFVLNSIFHTLFFSTGTHFLSLAAAFSNAILENRAAKSILNEWLAAKYNELKQKPLMLEAIYMPYNELFVQKYESDESIWLKDTYPTPADAIETIGDKIRKSVPQELAVEALGVGLNLYLPYALVMEDKNLDSPT